eukprot:9001334-Karenia_brevis.AAC.2
MKKCQRISHPNPPPPNNKENKKRFSLSSQVTCNNVAKALQCQRRCAKPRPAAIDSSSLELPLKKRPANIHGNICDRLAALVGPKSIHCLAPRKTDEMPPQLSIIDVFVMLTQLNKENAKIVFDKICSEYPKLNDHVSLHTFPGKGQRPTPVTSANGIIEFITCLPIKHAASVRREALEKTVRNLGADFSLIDRIPAMNTTWTPVNKQKRNDAQSACNKSTKDTDHGASRK